MAHLIKKSFHRKGNYWLARASEALSPLLRAGARAWAQGKPTPPAAWRKGLLLGADRIGDVLCRTGALPDLSHGLPECRWFYAASLPAAELLQTNPHLAGIVPLKQEIAALPWREVVRMIEAEAPDVVVCYDSGRYGPLLLAACAARVPNRVGFDHKGFSGLLTHPVRIDFPSPYAWSFRDMVAQITGQPRAQESRPLVYPTAGDEAAADALFQRLGLDPAVPVIACALFSRRSYENYAPFHYLETLRWVQARHPIQVVFIGAAGERAALEPMAAGCGLDYRIVAGELDLRALTCFLRRCTAAFTMDSALRHLANAAQIPVVFARSLNGHRVESGKYLSTETDVAPEIGNIPRAALTPGILRFDHEKAAQCLSALL